MSTAVAIDEKKYARLLGKTLPVVIETEDDYERLLERAKHLMDQDETALSLEETTLLSLLVHLIEQYEERHDPLGRANAHDLLCHLMEARGLTHKDIWPLFGSKGVASEVLNGKRAVSKTQAKKLAQFFHLSAELFI